jgi:hypothetical protein
MPILEFVDRPLELETPGRIANANGFPRTVELDADREDDTETRAWVASPALDAEETGVGMAEETTLTEDCLIAKEE